MIPIQSLGLTAVSAEALLRLELLLGERVVTLSVISDIVSQDAGLKTHVLQLARDCAPSDETDVNVDECIVDQRSSRAAEGYRQYFRRAFQPIDRLRPGGRA